MELDREPERCALRVFAIRPATSLNQFVFCRAITVGAEYECVGHCGQQADK